MSVNVLHQNYIYSSCKKRQIFFRGRGDPINRFLIELIIQRIKTKRQKKTFTNNFPKESSKHKKKNSILLIDDDENLLL